ncbi:PHA/PHB synthase family protein [Hephaestia mangrovi]|uniref:PHA/PHB synthase family protein n=1 Tax=Hephaestia mangrovi TaxID=2873268 RepID=UPI001CA788FA|nr:alpha/beta fold hydrolase [Hephaestia mangrovi]MBY8826553.1 alpha/beta fold hydrolase [Hephaestia mangrovi]
MTATLTEPAATSTKPAPAGIVPAPTAEAPATPHPLPPAFTPPVEDEADGALFTRLDQWLHGAEGRLTGGLSPLALGIASLEWGVHLANAPFRRAAAAIDGLATASAAGSAWCGATEIAPGPHDHRFTAEAWSRFPYHAMAQSFLLAEDWTDRMIAGVRGVSAPNERIVRFAARQMLDAFSPSNVPWLNPEIIDMAVQTRGRSLIEGFANYLADITAFAETGAPHPSARPMVLGRDLAATPGEVVFRNDLIELIQYTPATGKVRPEPVLITPAWIMKYYILDLSPHNSLIRYLTEQGYTVFSISWRNPGKEMRDLPFDAYRTQGCLAALDAVNRICGPARVHAVGYCLGGTLLSITAAAMARDGDDRLASMTLFAAQTDFTEAGELQLFMSEAQLAFLEDMMARQGYLDGRQMGGAFQLLRSRDLIWSRLIRSYWLGEEDQPNDLMVWNEDVTRMPARMHSEYLRRLFLNDDLAEGRYLVGGRPVALSDIHVPIFMVGTETDHVAPWHSVYKLHLLNPGEITFVLTSGGHNAGIVSEPGHPHRHFHIGTRAAGAPYVDPDSWVQQTPISDGSWWPAWTDWLAARSGAQDQAPPAMGARGLRPLADAPGTYVLER